MFEAKTRVFLTASAVFLALSVAAAAMIPCWVRVGQPEKTIEELAAEGMTHEFVQLAERFPERFERYFPSSVTAASYAEALTLGRDVYIAEACWHCHTQQVRPIPADTIRFGKASQLREHMAELQFPGLLGARRVGPDLEREAALRSNDWHLAHLYKPTSVVPTSVMPAYPWFFDQDGYPNKRGFAVVAYLQSLGS